MKTINLKIITPGTEATYERKKYRCGTMIAVPAAAQNIPLPRCVAINDEEKKSQFAPFGYL